MKVHSYEWIPWTSGPTTAGLNAIKSNKLMLNGELFSSNIPSLYTLGNLIEIDICTECFEPGCSSGGYVQVFEASGMVIWKEPLNERSGIREEPAEGIRQGTVYWDIKLYRTFMDDFGVGKSLRLERLSISQAMDLWRLHAKSSLASLKISEFKQLDEYVIGFYSTANLASDDIEQIYRNSKDELIGLVNTECSITVTTIDQKAIPLIAMMESNLYIEWNCLYLQDNKIIYPIGDEYGFYQK